MSITDELRGYVKQLDFLFDNLGMVCEKLTAIADRIDAEHEQQCAESWMRGHDAWAAIDRSDEMAEHGWIRLPKDADGKVWHVGDLAIGEVNPNNPKKVERMLWYGPDSGWQLETDAIIFPCPERVRHYQPPTVEDVLEKALNEAAMLDRQEGYWPSAADITNIVNSLAAKLQLREDA